MKTKLINKTIGTAVILLCSCADVEITDSNKPMYNGHDIAVGATAGYDLCKDTRTIYPGETVGNIERINWIDGKESYTGKWATDQICIYSQEAESPIGAPGKKSADYVLYKHTASNPAITMDPGSNKYLGGSTGTETTGVSGDNGYFTVVGPDGGLRWNTQLNVQDHWFYSVYPSARLNQSVRLYEDESKNIIFEGELSSSQHVVGFIKDSKNTNSYYAVPAMRQNYMWAIHQGNQNDIDANSISFDFRTLCSVLEIDLVWPQNMAENERLTSVMLTCTKPDVNLCGKFKVDMTAAKNGKTYPKPVSLSEAGVVQNSIIMNLDADPSDEAVGVTLKPGEHLKVRFIILPHENLTGDDLVLTVRGSRGQRSHDLSGLGLIVYPHKLNRVKNVSFPAKLTSSNWVSLLDDRVLLSQLSVPGSGSSYLINRNNVKTTAQCRTIQEQWNMGVRCFDITVGDGLSNRNFGDRPLRVDNSTTIDGSSVDNAFTTLLEQVKLTNPDGGTWDGEFGMMIVRYQPEGQRSAQTFVNDFETFFRKLKTTYSNRFCSYTPDMMIKDIRGKIVVILCPSSEGEDTQKMTFSDTDYLLVDGCGSLPDKFYKRGYSYALTNGTKHRVTKYAYGNSSFVENESAEYYIAYPDKGTISKGIADFSYPTNQTFRIYMQDWLRVIDGTPNAYVQGRDHKIPPRNVKWNNSYAEKLQDAKDTFMKSVGDISESRMIYINSLCGFLIMDASDRDAITPILDSWPAVKGNIKALASKINQDFYQFMYEQLRGEGKKGPMGVVMMNFVGDSSVPGSVMMPNMVLMNNFTFPLKIGGGSAKVATTFMNNNTNGWTFGN